MALILPTILVMQLRSRFRLLILFPLLMISC